VKYCIIVLYTLGKMQKLESRMGRKSTRGK
jgi:hypothetical protein